MSKNYIDNYGFTGEDYTTNALPKGEYENCTFSHCTFINADLSDITFIECSFEGCDLSMAKVKDAAFRDIQFKNCKLMGLRFDECNDFLLALDFEDCLLNYTSFYRLKLKNTKFKDCKMEDVELSEADLTYAVFPNCDLSGAMFDNTILENADFRTAINYTIDPENNLIARAKFSIQGIAGLLGKYKIVIEN
jgi:fluoroquinolone resistance protein